jgi:DNA-binding winged helix-turn-helix (wHTH) protein
MKFIINQQIIFDSDMSTLGLVCAQDELIQISNPTKRLLLVLIAHKGEAITREVIFKKVWDDYGMVSSNNNLNQCVSKLRKIVKNLGIEEEVIVTVPKVGFMLHQQVHVERCAPSEEHDDDILLHTETELTANNMLEIASAGRGALTFPQWFGTRFGYLNWILLFCSIAIMGSALGFWFASKPVDRREVYMGNAGNCKVMMSERALDSMKNPTLKKGIMDYVIRLNPQCHSNEYVLVIKSSTFKTYTSDLSRLYFMRCGILDENKSEVCWGLVQPG